MQQAPFGELAPKVGRKICLRRGPAATASSHSRTPREITILSTLNFRKHCQGPLHDLISKDLFLGKDMLF
jgi:hypothetical protein